MTGSLEVELEDSNRRIAELVAALEAEKRRVALAENLIAQSHGGGDLKLPAVKSETSTALSFRSLPSVVSWYLCTNKQEDRRKDQDWSYSYHQNQQQYEDMYASSLQPRGQGGTSVPLLAPEAIEVEDIRSFNEHEAPVWCCAFHPLVPLLATGGGDRVVRLWRMDGECLRVLRGHSEWVYGVNFSPSGDVLCSASFDGSLRVWDVSDGRCVRVMRAGAVNFLACSFDPLGSFIAAASSDKLIRLFRVSDGEVSRTLRGHTKEVTCVAFHPSDRLLASGSLDCSLRLWSTKSGEQLRLLGGRAQAKIWCCSFSPSGLLLASGGSDSIIRLWRVEDGEVLSTLTGHKGAVRSLAFDARGGGGGGELLISGEGNLMWGSDNSVRVWGPEEAGDPTRSLEQGESWKWRCHAVVLGHSKMITNVALPPDGSYFASSSRDGSVRLWSVNRMGGRGGGGGGGGGGGRGEEMGGGLALLHSATKQPARNIVSDLEMLQEQEQEGQLEHAQHMEEKEQVETGRSSEVEERTTGSGQMEGIAKRMKIFTAKMKRQENFAKPLIDGISKLWRGSLISEEELEKIRRQRQEGKTEEERARELYWNMYRTRLQHAADAVAEVTGAMSGEESREEDEIRGEGGVQEEAAEIAEKLQSITEALDEWAEEPEEAKEEDKTLKEEEKSEELQELEKMVKAQREGREAFEERIKSERDALQQLKVDVERAGAGMSSEELKHLIKAATYSGYRLAELKREKEEQLGEGKLGDLRVQRAKFEKFAAERRRELKEQAEKIQDLLEQLQERQKYEQSTRPSSPPASSWRDEDGGDDRSFFSLYCLPLPPHVIGLSSEEGDVRKDGEGDGRRGGEESASTESVTGRRILKTSGPRGEAMALRVLEMSPPPPPPHLRHLAALALVLNAVQLEGGRLWQGPWRQYSASALRLLLPAQAESDQSLPLLADLGEAAGASARVYRAEESEEEELREVLRSSVFGSTPDMDEEGVVRKEEEETLAGVLALIFHEEDSSSSTTAASFACICAYSATRDMALLVEMGREGGRRSYWISLTDLWRSISPPLSRSGRKGGYITLKRGADEQQTGLLSFFCVRDMAGNLLPMQDFILALESMAPATIQHARDPGGVLAALIAAAMSRGHLVQHLHRYERIVAHGEGLLPRHREALWQVMTWRVKSGQTRGDETNGSRESGGGG